MCKKFFPELRVDEQIYLDLHLLGSRLSVPTKKFFEDAEQIVLPLLKRVACVYFSERDEIERALFIHIRSSLYRFICSGCSDCPSPTVKLLT